jgi:hypothetical protein
MNLELTLNKLSKKHNFDFTLESLQYNTQRAVIPCSSYNTLCYIESVLRHVKNFRIDNWTAFDGIFEGYIYVMTNDEYEILKTNNNKQMEDHWNWWERYNKADAETKRLMACGAIQ